MPSQDHRQNNFINLSQAKRVRQIELSLKFMLDKEETTVLVSRMTIFILLTESSCDIGLCMLVCFLIWQSKQLANYNLCRILAESTEFKSQYPIKINRRFHIIIYLQNISFWTQPKNVLEHMNSCWTSAYSEHKTQSNQNQISHFKF